MVLNGTIIIVYDNDILTEYLDLLNRGRLNINKELINSAIDFIEKEGEFMIASPLEKKLDADYLITGNKKHFPKEKGIVTPREFLEQADNFKKYAE